MSFLRKRYGWRMLEIIGFWKVFVLIFIIIVICYSLEFFKVVFVVIVILGYSMFFFGG